MKPVKALRGYSCWQVGTGHYMKFPESWVLPVAFFKNENKRVFRDLTGSDDDTTLTIMDMLGTNAMLFIAPDGRIMLAADTISDFHDRDQD